MLAIFYNILFVAASWVTAGGVAILQVLAPVPVSLSQHLRAFARYAVIGGALFCGVWTIIGWRPPWFVAAAMIGLAWLIGDHARETHLIALLHERLNKKPVPVDSETETGV